MRVDLPDWPWEIVLDVAQERAVPVWAVGGAVRDALLDTAVHDWDFAVQGDSLALARAVADRLGGAFFPLDAERDTGRVIADSPAGESIEIDFAGLRGSDLAEDLAGRDFTVNALAVDTSGDLVAVTRGWSDLQNRIVRAASEAAFQDDPVRLLRAVRFEAQLAGFAIEPQTARWIERDAPLLVKAAPERVRDETVRLLETRPAMVALERLDSLGLLGAVFPELVDLQGVAQSPPHRFDVYRHSLLVLDALERVLVAIPGEDTATAAPQDAPPGVWEDAAGVLGRFAAGLREHLSFRVKGGRDRGALMKLAALLHDVGKAKTYSYDETGMIRFEGHGAVGAEITARRMKALHFSGEEVARVSRLVAHHARPSRLEQEGKLDRRTIFRYFRAAGNGGVELALCSLADLVATFGPNLKEDRWSRRLQTVETLLTHYFERYEETVAPPPLITGVDLIIELGIESGPEIGRLLGLLREAQAAGEIEARSEALALARRLHGSA